MAILFQNERWLVSENGQEAYPPMNLHLPQKVRKVSPHAHRVRRLPIAHDPTGVAVPSGPAYQ
jgi:hypothetical protein